MKTSITITIILLGFLELYSQNVGHDYALDINNIYLPLNNRGVLADVNVLPGGSGGQFGGHPFLFSGGFFLSGYSNGQLWANAVATASLVEDYLGGTYSSSLPLIFKLNTSDEPFVSQSWQDWEIAVVYGADFYDGNGDGIYTPIDLNGNGQWDANEDRPDILGDETLWCVYHDGKSSNLRRWNTVEPQGIEIRQTLFAYSSIPELQNIIFIRYRITNTGTLTNEMTDVYFGIWDDPDVGDHTDDLVGSDTLLQGGYTYNDGDDTQYGMNPPTFFAAQLSGPVTYIPGETFIDNNSNGKYDEGVDTPLDTAIVNRGEVLGINMYAGAKNQELSSSVNYRQSDPNLGDPNTKEEARNYMLGRNRVGEIIDPCTSPYGQVFGGVNCSEVNPLFWYSGDPVTSYGWVHTSSTDQRQTQNNGPFNLEEGKEVEVFVAYSVGQGTDALSSITEAKLITTTAQRLYQSNFDPTSITSIDDLISEFKPDNFSLFQNYPNPFNPSTKISWQSPVGGHQSLKVYDVLGDEVATLVNEYKPAGNYEVEWDASGLPSGVYFYQLKTEGYFETKKMILMK